MLIIDVVCTLSKHCSLGYLSSVGLFIFCFLVVEDLQSNFFTSGNMVPICLCSSYFYGHGKILFVFLEYIMLAADNTAL